jgi:hypothetical protein
MKWLAATMTLLTCCSNSSWRRRSVFTSRGLLMVWDLQWLVTRPVRAFLTQQTMTSTFIFVGSTRRLSYWSLSPWLHQRSRWINRYRVRRDWEDKMFDENNQVQVDMPIKKSHRWSSEYDYHRLYLGTVYGWTRGWRLAAQHQCTCN